MRMDLLEVQIHHTFLYSLQLFIFFIFFTTLGTIVLHISFMLEFPGDFFNKVKTVSLCLPNSASGSKHRFLFSFFHFPM